LHQRGAGASLAAARAALPLSAQAEAVPCDLAGCTQVHALLRGVDAIVHLGGVGVERPIGPIMAADIQGLHCLDDAESHAPQLQQLPKAECAQRKLPSAVLARGRYDPS